VAENPTLSILVVLKDNDELGRIMAGTRRTDIKVLWNIALSAALS
tara:strand:- start:276 stop:410 length:135 start_codon:yes stop_codon:yes gene_type:complete